MIAQVSWMDLIRKRTSCRSFNGKPLPTEMLASLERAFSRCLGNPFGTAVRLPILGGEKLAYGKLGTYGVIRGASVYLAGIVKNGTMDHEALGYSMERAVLQATAMGLGTCWLAGTYNRADFASAVTMGEDERIVCVSPVGWPADMRTFLDTMMRSAVGSAKRKPWNVLFFDGSFRTLLSEEAAGEWRSCLEAVRLAPSGSNGQPWRVVRKGSAFHFYRHAGSGVDMGIAACHFELVARERGLAGGWVVADQGIAGSENMVYSFTWQL